MKHIMRLEIRKFKLKKQIKGVLIAIFFIMVFLTISFIDTMSDPRQTKDIYNSILQMINILVTGTFIVYSSVWTSELIISEYTNHTILIMFSYPIDRKKLILTKLFMISSFTAVSTLLGFVCCISYVILLDTFFDVLVGSFVVKYIYLILWETLSGVVLSVVVSLIPFVVGIRKKSSPWTIVTSILVMCIMQAIIGQNPGRAEFIVKIGVIAAFVFLALKYTLNNKIGNLDGV